MHIPQVGTVFFCVFSKGIEFEHCANMRSANLLEALNHSAYLANVILRIQRRHTVSFCKLGSGGQFHFANSAKTAQKIWDNFYFSSFLYLLKGTTSKSMHVHNWTQDKE
jgi:hypothetical protein